MKRTTERSTASAQERRFFALPTVRDQAALRSTYSIRHKQ